MSDFNPAPPARARHRRPCRQKGVGAVEFALVAVVFFTVIFGVIDLARLMYLFNTLQEVTRRAADGAANTDFTKIGALDGIRQSAIFRTSRGNLAFSEVTDDAIRIEYMSIQRDSTNGSFTAVPVASMPTSPAENRRTCLVNPYADNCIRLVQVRVCDPGTTSRCDSIMFRSIIPLVNLDVPLPRATTVVKAESLGLTAGS